MTDRIREMLREEAEKEGEDAEEVIMVAEMRLKQNPNGIMPKVDKKAFDNYVMSAEEEIEIFVSQGYHIVQTKVCRNVLKY